MRRSTILAASILAYLLTAAVANALITPYEQRDIAAAGVGCVGGLKSDHGSVAYFVGATEILNEQLEILAARSLAERPVTVVLHVGAKTVDAAEEERLTVSGNEPRHQVVINWSVNTACPFERVAKALCQCEKRSVPVHIWIANQIRLQDLIVPNEFVVRSAGEIDDFIKKHAERQ